MSIVDFRLCRSLRWILVANLLLFDGGCFYPVADPEPIKVAGYLPYVESITFPDEIHAYRSFEATIQLSTELNPALLDNNYFLWQEIADHLYVGEGNATGIELLRLAKSDDLYLNGEFLGNHCRAGVTPDQIIFTYAFTGEGTQGLRLLSMPSPSLGGTPVAMLLHTVSEGPSWWSYPDGLPAGAAYREFTTSVLPPEFDDIYARAYVPYIEEFVAPAQLMSSELLWVLLRLSSQAAAGDPTAQLVTSANGAGSEMLLYYDGTPPPVGPDAQLITYEAGEPANTFSVLSAAAPELGGLELVMLKYPESGLSPIKPGQTGYTFKSHTVEVIPYQPHEYNETWEVRLPYAAAIAFDTPPVAGRPGVIRIELAADLPGATNGLGYYLHQPMNVGAGRLLLAAPYYEAHPQGRPLGEMLYFHHELEAGEYTLRVVSAPDAASGGMAVTIGVDTEPQAVLPAGAVYRDFEFTVTEAE
ncbi:hypothetical protein JW859_01365 [bacterium]|nr:hypothetical protein [bacterium]